MDLFLYILVSTIYIMLIHFAMAIRNEFNVFLMTGIFVFTGVIGGLMQSYEMAFVAGIILSLLFW